MTKRALPDYQPLTFQKIFIPAKRPVAPDVETKITCAIAEAIVVAGYGTAMMLQFVAIYLLLNDDYKESVPAYVYLPMIALLCFTALTSLRQIPKSNGQPLAYWSGIPEKRTRFSRFLRVIAAILVAVWFGGVTANMVGLFKPMNFAAYNMVALGVFFVLLVLHDTRRVQELLLWVLDLRAQQGHQISFEDHPMAVPIVVENDWWKKPKSPTP